MTREEAIKELKIIREDYWDEYDDPMPALDMAIKALEQEPCEDTISRAAAVKVASGYCHPANIAQELAKLPPVQPKLTECEDCVSRAELKKWLDMNFSFGGAARKFELFDRLDKELPPVTPKPETAHWIKVPGEETFFCSKCNCRLDDEQTYLPLNFCPNCGRKMVEPQESEKSK